MRILFLDDDYTRHGQFKVNHREDDITQVWDYAQAVTALLAEPAFDLAHLDHDLELTHDKASRCMNGVDVVKFILTLPDQQRPRRVIIHSWNELERQRMHDLLCEAGIPSEIKPFGPGT